MPNGLWKWDTNSQMEKFKLGSHSKKPQMMEWHLGKAGVVSKKVNHCHSVAFVGIFEVFTRCKFLGQGNRKSST